jgi:hypothetical protein
MAVGAYPIAVNVNTGDLTYDALVGGPLSANLLTTGEETCPRELINSSSLSTTSGILRLTYWTARKTESITQVKTYSGGTAAGATPTLVRIGVYSIDSAGAGSLVASTVSDTSLYAGTVTPYTKSFSATFNKTAGARYALGVLVVTGATAPTVAGNGLAISTEALIAPYESALLSGQTDLPNSFAQGSLSASGNRVYAALLP